MIVIPLKRQIISNKAILGTIYNTRKQIIGKTLENPWRDNQKNISCVPPGEYDCAVDNTGRFQYWKILGVPGRSGIEIHQGNKEKHTRGCILIGKEWCFMEGELAVSSSKLTLDNLKENKILPEKFKLRITVDY